MLKGNVVPYLYDTDGSPIRMAASVASRIKQQDIPSLCFEGDMGVAEYNQINVLKFP